VSVAPEFPSTPQADDHLMLLRSVARMVAAEPTDSYENPEVYAAAQQLAEALDDRCQMVTDVVAARTVDSLDAPMCALPAPLGDGTSPPCTREPGHSGPHVSMGSGAVPEHLAHYARAFPTTWRTVAEADASNQPFDCRACGGVWKAEYRSCSCPERGVEPTLERRPQRGTT
jgi:hypothetical protein